MPESSSTTGNAVAPVASADDAVESAGLPEAPRLGSGTEADIAGGIGRRLAAHRARRGLKVAELARGVGVTPSLISQIERGHSRPSVSTLFALAQALDVPVDAFFRESPRSGEPARAPGENPPEAPGGHPGQAGGRYLVRKQNRAGIDIEGGVRWERLTRNTMDHLDFFELIYQPGAESHPRQYTHPGTEMVLMMRGCLEITVGFESYRLLPGDSIDFPSSMPHRYLNPGEETAHAVTVILYDCPREHG
jgi:transcriptional regulator with XRE-family HTH domain